MEQVSVFGLGRVGLVMAACLAKRGFKVVGINSDERIVEHVRKAKAHFFESNLTEYLRVVVGDDSLSVFTDSTLNVKSHLAFICVGTPSKQDGSIDLAYVENV